MTGGGQESATRRILIIDDVVPTAAKGSGYPRMVETITAIQAVPGVTVTLFPVAEIRSSMTQPKRIGRWEGSYPLEVVRESLEGHLRRSLLAFQPYDLVIISRPHNYEFVIETIRRYLPKCPIVYDAEALFYRRIERQLELGVDGAHKRLRREAATMRALEEEIPATVDEVVCVSEAEAEIMRKFSRGPVTVHSPLLQGISLTERGFDDRAGVGFIAGWSAGANSPNGDGMRWFAREVWPRVLARDPDAQLIVTGGRPPTAVRRFACSSITFSGRVDDLLGLYGNLRVVVVPNRYGAGVKNKTIEALQAGVPVVATSVGAEGMPIPGFVDGTVSPNPSSPPYLVVTDDPTEFAEQIVALLNDQALWEQDRSLLEAQIADWERERAQSTWSTIIERLVPRAQVATEEQAVSP